MVRTDALGFVSAIILERKGPPLKFHVTSLVDLQIYVTFLPIAVLIFLGKSRLSLTLKVIQTSKELQMLSSFQNKFEFDETSW